LADHDVSGVEKSRAKLLQWEYAGPKLKQKHLPIWMTHCNN